MKRLSFIVCICIASLSAMAQDSTKIKQHNNEFGIDMTGFLKQYLEFGNNQQFVTTYTPTYYLTYRRHFSCGNLRIEFGGDFFNDKLPGNNSQDTNIGYNKGYSFAFNLGWEWYDNLSKKWQVYYGAQIQSSLNYSHDDQTNESGPNYIVGRISKTETIGIAPLLGIRFKISKRLSILTEASYSINWESVFNGNYYILSPGGIGPLPPTNSQKSTLVYSSFTQPLDVFIDFAL